MCWISSSKTFWKKKDVKERDPKGTSKTLMTPIKVWNLMEVKNLKETPNLRWNNTLVGLNHNTYQI